jgi:hypothetical protein
MSTCSNTVNGGPVLRRALLMSLDRLQNSEPNQQTCEGKNIKYDTAFMVQATIQETRTYFYRQHGQRKDPDRILAMARGTTARTKTALVQPERKQKC